MTDKVPFRIAQGLEEAILNTTPIDGYVYFALDTKRIFYGDSVSGFLPMGGNSGIYYGKYIPPDNVDSDVELFYFTLNDIEDRQLPNINDLILNLPNGCFYRVLEHIKEENADIIIKVEKLKVSGGGGGGISAIPPIIRDENKTSTKYFTLDQSVMKLTFSVSSSIADNSLDSLTIFYKNTELKKWSGIDFGTFEFDLKPYINLLNLDSGNTISIVAIDQYGGRKTFDYTIHLIKISLDLPTTQIKQNILLFNQDSYYYQCVPKGSNKLTDITLNFEFYALNGIKIENYSKSLSSKDLGSTNSVNLIFTGSNKNVELEDGSYLLKVYLKGKYTSDNKEFYETSESLDYQVIRHGGQDTSIFAIDFQEKEIKQYTTLSVPCMVADRKNETAEVKFSYINTDTKEINDISFTIKTNTVEFLTWYCSDLGTYDFEFSYKGEQVYNFYSIKIIEYKGEIPTIQSDGLILNLSSVNRSNNQTNKNQWVSNGATTTFENFYWGDINGWLKDKDTGNSYLHLSSGASITIENFAPFAKNILDLEDNSRAGMTIELDFRISGVLNYNSPLISCISKNDEEVYCGFQLTGDNGTFNTSLLKATGGEILEGEDAQIVNTAIQGLTARYVENERIKLTWVIEKNTNNTDFRPKITTFINGIISGFTPYAKGDSIVESKDFPAKFIVNSENADIDIYNIRFYEIALTPDKVLDNYIATLNNNDEKVEKYSQNNITEDGLIKLSKIEAEGYNLRVPYIKLTGGLKIDKEWNIDGKSTDKRLPIAKKDFRLMDLEYVDLNRINDNEKFTTKLEYTQDGKVRSGCKVYGQGTSSMEYPTKNLRIEFMSEGKTKKVSVLDNLPPVKRVCLKADYMESSGSHNTGTAGLVDEILAAAGWKTPGQNFYDNLSNYEYDTVTAIKGFPIIVFWSPTGEKDSYEFVGKYNFNLDKADQNPFGFAPYPKEEKDVDPENLTGTLGWQVIDGQPKDVIRCFEILNNFNALSNFKNEKEKIKDDSGKWILETHEDYDAPISLEIEDIQYAIDNNISLCDNEGYESFYHCFFKKYNIDEEGNASKILNDENKGIYNWQGSYEARYPDPDPNPLKGEDDNYIDREYAIQFYEMCAWVESTRNNLEEFKNNLHKYFNQNFLSFYYVISHFLLMIDSRAKNLMIASWGPETPGGKHIWYPIFYDMDTMLGLNNYGYNKYKYDSLDIDPNLYNGHESILWNNYRQGFYQNIAQTYDTIRGKGLTYDNLINIYNNKQANAWNETICNEDAEYKYERPFNEGFWSVDDNNNTIFIEKGKKDYYYASQGRRSMHRQNWLSNRFPFMDGFYLSSPFKSNRFVLRIYTPQGNQQYFKLTIENEAEFNDLNNYYGGIYYYENGEYKRVEAWTNELLKIDLFRKATEEETGKLDASIIAVPPDNNFKLTSLKNTYLSVAYGGSNGTTTTPKKASANIEVEINIPNENAIYNDTETYIYGGSELQSLGDLSSQYLGRFDFPDIECKLRALTLGNKSNDYYNPNFSQINIGNNAPYLEYLNLMNCSGLSRRSIDLSYCLRLKNILATGTGLTGITLPDFGVIEELRMPETLRILNLKNQPYLNNEYFTIGSYDSKSDKYENDFSKLTTISIENVPNLDSYEMISAAVDGALEWIYLPDINWTVTKENEIFYDDNTGEINFTILEKLKDLTPISSTMEIKNAIKGTIVIDIENLKINAIDLYNKYIEIFPYIKFKYGTSISEESALTKTYTFKNLSGAIIWEKQLSEKLTSIPVDFFENSYGYGALRIPSKPSDLIYKYNFIGWIKEEDVDKENPTVYSHDSLIKELDIDNYVLIPKFNIKTRKYSIIYNDVNGNKLEEIEFFATDSQVPESTYYPYKDSSLLDLEKCYIFKNYKDKNQGNLNADIKTWKVTSNYEVTPIFEEGSVYDNILDEKYYSIYDNGYISLNHSNLTGVELKGKITLPINENIKGFSSLSENTQITHIFWKPSNVELETFTFGENCCMISNIIYFQPPSTKNIIVKSQAFNSCSYFMNNISDAKINEFFENMVTIYGYSFLSCSSLEGKELSLLKATSIGSLAFLGTKLKQVKVKSGCQLEDDSFDSSTTISIIQ